jgi:hypothetical protein
LAPSHVRPWRSGGGEDDLCVPSVRSSLQRREREREGERGREREQEGERGREREKEVDGAAAVVPAATSSLKYSNFSHGNPAGVRTISASPRCTPN